MAAPLVELALDYSRDPLVYRHLAEARRPLPRGFDVLLAEFCMALSAARIVQTAEQFAVDPAEMEEAARFFVRHVLLSPEGDYYRHLGLSRDATQESIRHHYQLLIRMFHPDRVEASTELGAFYATRINLAYQTLRDPETRAAYDRGLPELPADFTETDSAWFFRPNPAVYAGMRQGWFPRGRGTRGRPSGVDVAVVGAIVLGTLVLGLGYMLFQANEKPALRLAASGSGETAVPLPGYLAPAARISGSGGRAAGDPLPPLEPAPVDGALSEQDRTGIRAVEDTPVRLVAVPVRAPVSPTEPPTPSATANNPRLEQTIDTGRLEPVRLKAVGSESARVVGAVLHDDLVKAHEPEALVIPPVLAASAAVPAGVPPPKAIEPERSAEPMRLSAAPTRAVDAASRRPETDTAIAPEAQPATPPKAELPELPKMQPVVAPAAQPKTAPKAIPPAPPVKPASRRAEELQADRLAPKSTAAAPTPAAPAQPARSVAAAVERAPSVAPSRPAATPEKDAAALVARLKSTYEARNADGFAALFTANAHVNEGRGRELIRSMCAELFQRTTGAKLSINNVRWRVLPDGRISGAGAISVGNLYRGAGRWRYAAGRVDLELVREGGEYRIASMIGRLK